MLILDEPTENLDPNVRSIVTELVRESRGRGQAVLFSSHVLSEVEDVADRAGILCKGRLVHEQDIASIRKKHRIVAQCSVGNVELPEEFRQFVEVPVHRAMN
ncbi:MAG: hypothetical protein R3C03_15260 [Pirellulaceae bacterium]